ncbi:hypothetical protein JMA_22590 [Jeotgalibacillus malaysiensis]|uniref:HTH cro/C1-type domain-containing protein n=1 Tax=Jeotgalibacillus malaysiensis TaxID=1508404 RepID=A0A0B5AN54_9BACL|nr:helix-turn-helix transcriptional regulator [Jeotgalibacillus malaysiensis]AJD91576.1 hypothetical protein JMA_22590 [Jeotgalibacillus malaysiensis]
MELKEYVGKQIKKWREIRGYSQEDLATMINTTKQTISRYETGARHANQDVLFDIAKALKVSINVFFPADQETKDSKLETIAAHIDEDVTDEELEDIKRYIQFLKSQRK